MSNDRIKELELRLQRWENLSEEYDIEDFEVLMTVSITKEDMEGEICNMEMGGYDEINVWTFLDCRKIESDSD